MQGRGRSTRVLGCRLLRYLRHRDRWLLKVGGGEEGAGIDGIKSDVAGLINGGVNLLKISVVLSRERDPRRAGIQSPVASSGLGGSQHLSI